MFLHFWLLSLYQRFARRFAHISYPTSNGHRSHTDNRNYLCDNRHDVDGRDDDVAVAVVVDGDDDGGGSGEDEKREGVGGDVVAGGPLSWP